MATKAQRVKSIVDALTNKDMGQEFVVRVLNAMLGLEPEQVENMLASEKLDRFLLRIRSHVLEQVKAYEQKTLVKQAIDTTRTQVETDYSEGE